MSLADHRHLALLARRINDRLPSKFPGYAALYQRPFAFLGRKDELVSRIMTNWGSTHPLVASFTIRPKFELDARLYELRDGETKVGLFIDVSTRWEIAASLIDLKSAGIDLTGLAAVRRTPAVDERRLVGRISHIDDTHVYFSEAYDGIQSIAAEEVRLEGNRSSFKRCLSVLLGHRFASSRIGGQVRKAIFWVGQGWSTCIRRWGTY